MYKLKDNIDLQQLEKYGFRKISLYGDEIYCKSYSHYGELVDIAIKEDRSFDIYWGYYAMFGEEQERFIQDLIKADLIEKVEVLNDKN